MKGGSGHAGPRGSVQGHWLLLGGSGESVERVELLSGVAAGGRGQEQGSQGGGGSRASEREMAGLGPEQQQCGWLGPGVALKAESSYLKAVLTGSALGPLRQG